VKKKKKKTEVGFWAVFDGYEDGCNVVVEIWMKEKSLHHVLLILGIEA
jgi:hypothetical protein